MKQIGLIFTIAVLIILATVKSLSIPAKFDGFVYKTSIGEQIAEEDKIKIEAFLDPVCPDSRDAWPPLKKAIQFYGSKISLIVHPFPLPYHDNAFVTSRALHIVNRLNSSATYDLLELIFEHQEKFYNAPTFNMSRDTVVKHVSSLVVEAVGSSLQSSVESGFTDRKTDLATRVSFKYGCSRGVYGTPFFFVNGFVLPDAGDAIDYDGWRSILDPLFGSHSQERFFL
ncbi:hypothetical protein ACHQM5_016596 [Ranunculus cassubicifolius]